MRTSDLLVDYCNKSQIPDELSVICDYFEFGNTGNINLDSKSISNCIKLFYMKIVIIQSN
jgi:hypothetical protein